MDELAIPQTTAHIGLRLHAPERGPSGDLRYITAEIAGQNLTARSRVYVYPPLGLSELLDGLARDWAGWSGAREWESLEGELKLRCTSDGKGHVYVATTLRESAYPDSWQLSGVAMTEAGQLERLAHEARRFETGEDAA